MLLIADSGSTSTDWSLVSKRLVDSYKTTGINPFYQTEEEISLLLSRELSVDISDITAIRFYGAGCAGEREKNMLLGALNKHFKIKNIQVESDLLAAARSLCGHNEGIAAILGTGSNSCYYDGNKIVAHVSPLGYILGDEGSGAVLGRKLIGDILKKQLPESICKQFWDTFSTKPSDVMDKVYRQPFPNRFLAGFTGFIKVNIHHEEIYKIVKESFEAFFNRNIKQYPQYQTLPTHFTGSIALHFKEILKAAAESTGCHTGIITENPMEGLINYHVRELK